MRLALMVASALAACVTPALAADHDFTVTNSTEFDIVAIHVEGGKVNNFKTVASNGERQFTLTLPDGVCETRLNFIFSDSDSVVANSYDACNTGGMTISH